MARNGQEFISFVQYQECSLCHSHHKDGYRHVYSKSHQANVGKILSRFKKKILKSKSALVSPQLSDIALHKPSRDFHLQNSATNKLLLCSKLGISAPLHSALLETVDDGVKAKPITVWCYFCAKEVHRDLQMGVVLVESGGFIEHLACDTHRSACSAFWKLHAVDKHHNHKEDKFCLSDEQLNVFKKRVAESVKTYEDQKAKATRSEADRIRKQAAHRARIVTCHRQMLEQAPNHTTAMMPISSWQHASQSFSREPLQRVRTVAAKSDGLSCFALKNFDDHVGNIHTGTLPPWMSDSRRPTHTVTMTTTDNTIRPNQEDFTKHLEEEKKGRLPACRVGAKEKLSENYSGGSEWLPSFGRVWSKKARTQTRKQFMNATKSNHTMVKSEDHQFLQHENRSGLDASQSTTSMSSVGQQQYGMSAMTSQDNQSQSIEYTSPAPAAAITKGKGYIRKRPYQANSSAVYPRYEPNSSVYGSYSVQNGQTSSIRHQQSSTGTGYSKRTKLNQYDGQYQRIDVSNKFL